MSDKVEQIIEFDGVQYLLIDTAENIDALRTDPVRLHRLINENVNSSLRHHQPSTSSPQPNSNLRHHHPSTTSPQPYEIYSQEENISLPPHSPAASVDDDFCGFAWTNETEKFFVSLLLEREKQYRSPCVKRKAFWESIRFEFSAKYDPNITCEILSKKLANIKRKYLGILKNNKTSGAGALRHWHIQEDVADFFKKDETVQRDRKNISSMPSASNDDLLLPESAHIADGCPLVKPTENKRRAAANENYYKEKKIAKKLEEERIQILKKNCFTRGKIKAGKRKS